MRILVAGASGVVGRQLLPQLVARGHEVTGLVRSVEGAAVVATLGGRPVIADGLNAAAVRLTVLEARPEAVIHQMTAIDPFADLRRFDDAFAQTNRLRSEGTDNLVTASREVGVRRFVAQSFCGHTWAREGTLVKTEDDPFDPNPPPQLRATHDAIRHVEAAMLAAGDLNGVALRYSGFYGPGTNLAANGALVQQVRRRKVPLIGRGSGIWSFLHVADAASAAVAAVESTATGVFNVSDDEPVAVRDWLPEVARILGARPPRRLPLPLARLLVPRHLVQMMTEARGASNARFKETFGWIPTWPSWLWGLREVLAS
jgi:2-alkyl-3-oxoalkanoate reductase